MSSGKVLASVLAGAAAGAILGILFAPDKGTETRRKIAERGAGLADGVRSRVTEFADGIADKYESVKDQFTGGGAGNQGGQGGQGGRKANDVTSGMQNTMNG